MGKESELSENTIDTIIDIINRLEKLEQKVSNPEWLDVLILDLVKPQLVEFEINLLELLTKTTHINTYCEGMEEVYKELKKLKEDITNVADSSGNFEDMLLRKITELKNDIVYLKGQIIIIHEKLTKGDIIGRS